MSEIIVIFVIEIFLSPIIEFYAFKFLENLHNKKSSSANSTKNSEEGSKK